MPLIDYLNEFLNSSLSLPINVIHYPPLYQLVEVFWRAGPSAPGLGPGPSAPKCFDQLIKGWIPGG